MENLASAYRKLKREQISSIVRPATMKRKNKGVWVVQCTKLIYKGVVRLPSVFHGSPRASSSLLLLYVHNALFLNSMASVVSLSLSLSLAHHALCVFFFFLSSYFYIINALYISPFATLNPANRQRNHRLRIVTPPYYHFVTFLPPFLSLPMKRLAILCKKNK